jgi:hypothetical protein
LSIELSTPDKSGSSEETRDWELRLGKGSPAKGWGRSVEAKP